MSAPTYGASFVHRSELEHILRAAGAISDEKVMIVVGSQAILASLDDPPEELVVSLEADLYPRDAPEKAELITGSIGEYSIFHETFGYHGDGVSPQTAVVPASWAERLVPLKTGEVTGLCLHPVDLAVSKLADEDFDYVRALLRHGIVSASDVTLLLPELAPEQASLVESRLKLCELPS